VSDHVPVWFSAVSLALFLPVLHAQADPSQWLEDCHRFDHGDRARVCRVRETGMRAPGGTLTVEPGPNGGVAVIGWDRDSVGVIAEIQARAETEGEAASLADAVHIEVSGSAIRASGPTGGADAHWSVSFEVYVPHRTDLALATLNGPLSVEDVTGAMDLRAQNGPVSLTGVGGQVTSRVQNGPLSVELTGRRWDGSGLDAEAVNGPVDLAIPEGYNARLETGTVNGPMDLAFPLTVTIQGRLTNRIQATLGQGGAPVRVVTRNGPLTIRRAR
jgi:DUF4097 and DUF4098 domain-containing protein YvlB